MYTFTLKPVSLEEREILANLLEKYLYEFSQYTEVDVNPLGLYGYMYLDYTWTQSNRWAYFIMIDDALAGFVMVNDYPEAFDRITDFSLSEFFILHKYRRNRVGTSVFETLCSLHKGSWQLKCHPKNIPSVKFWEKVISTYTLNNYEKVVDYPNSHYEDGSLGTLFFFES
ncbi:acetyltransferase [Erysipelothrix larvae]|uniref:Acetyltransferase n=1 Tax=Erysipelothrix larvae TaxID=1514105 RepID=A0A0X8GZP5_9FIRM|nr:GNAT family N-acetyltransferase [Erysipelothrix larvae]AMC93386.1 acetyltransferase [Erysipelothrix larvae]